METAGKSARRRASGPGTATPRKTRPAKVAPSRETVAVRLLEAGAAAGQPTLWKEAELKRKLSAAERPVLAAALDHLLSQHRLLEFKGGKTTLYLFAEPLRAWLVAREEKMVPASGEVPMEAIRAAYTVAVGRSGGFPDVKISVLQAELGRAGVDGGLARALVALWRAGSATLSQGDWSLADEATRAAAVEINGERYLLVRLEDEASG